MRISPFCKSRVVLKIASIGLMLSPQSVPTDVKKPHISVRLINTGVADGARTHDNRNHNPGLYQLSYSHHRN